MTKQLTLRAGTLLAPQLDYILVDGSSSMADKWWDFMGGLDGFMDTLRAQNIHSQGIVQVFDSADLDSIQRDSLISEWPRFSDEPLGLNYGMTPLYDAINRMGWRLRELNPPRCSTVVVTDGEENGSRIDPEGTRARAILNWMRAKGWQVTFLGCDFDNEEQAKRLGMDKTNTIGVRKQKLLEAGKSLGEKRVRNIISGDEINFSDDERKKFGGFLTGPSGSK